MAGGWLGDWVADSTRMAVSRTFSVKFPCEVPNRACLFWACRHQFGGALVRVVVKLLGRLFVVASMVAISLFVPQRVAWAAPETRTQIVNTTDEQVTSLDIPATHAVVSWTGDAKADVVARTADKAGNWSAWKKVVVDDEGLPEQSGMVVVENAVKVQVDVRSGVADNLKVRAIDTKNGPRHMVLQSAEPKADALAGTTPQPSVIPRSEWGADESLRKGTPEFAPITRVIVHHTATDNNDPNPAATVRAILSWHTQGNGWNDIGYNFLIDSAGNIYEGRKARTYSPGEIPTGEDTRGNGVIGAHASNNNTGTVGISMIGNFSEVAPSAAQQEALAKLIAWKADKHNLDVTAPGIVVGHRDVGQTECPGNVGYTILPSIRDRANAIKTLSFPPGNTPGYWISAADGSVKPYGNAADYGSMAGKHLNSPITSMTRTPSGKGYWLMGADGGMFSFGDAQFYGSMGGHRLNAPVVGLAPTPSGRGYWLVASDGGIFNFGDAAFYGSMGGKPLNKPVVGIAATKSGHGYWLVASDGGIFNYGDAGFLGSTGSLKLAQPVVTMAATPNGSGYWLFARDGGVFSFGDSPFRGSIPLLKINAAPIVEATATATGGGYYMLSSVGGLYSFGDARFWGAPTGSGASGMALVPES